MNYFVTAIHTDSGKTLVSAILCEALLADYWKPIQAGYPTDTETVRQLISNSTSTIHPENHRLRTPASPHAAAALERVALSVGDLVCPQTTRDLIIEGAGGCLVPINENEFIIDIASRFDAQVILVSNLYLGSINHTLLTFEALKKRHATIRGIIFNGVPNLESEKIILHHTGLPCLLRIQQEKEITKETVKHYAAELTSNWNSGIVRNG